MGKRLLRNAQLVSQLLLRQSMFLASVRDAGTECLEKLFVLGVHGQRQLYLNSHEDTSGFCGVR